jgi:LacI family transcriptional regulator, galactose operon repressor
MASALIYGALVEARSRGYVLFIAKTEGQPDAEHEAFDALIDRQVDGLIYATSWSRKLELPAPPPHTRLVLLNAVSDDVPTAVLPDELRGGREIVDLLLDAGHRDDLVVIGRSLAQPEDEWHTPTVRRRIEGIWASLRARRQASRRSPLPAVVRRRGLCRDAGPSRLRPAPARRHLPERPPRLRRLPGSGRARDQGPR